MTPYETAMVNVSAEGQTPGYVRVSAIVALMPAPTGSRHQSLLELSTGTQWRSPLSVEEITERMDRALELARRRS